MPPTSTVMLTQLPHELLLSIASFLPHPDLVSLQRTNSLFLHLLTPAVWSNVVLVGHSSPTNPRRWCECPCSDTTWSLTGYADERTPDFGYCWPREDFGRRLITGQDRNRTVRRGLLHAPHDDIFRHELGFVREAVFLLPFFGCEIGLPGEPAGEGIARVSRFLRKLTGLRKVIIAIGDNYNHDCSSKSYRKLDPYMRMQAHPALRFDLWLQPLLDVFPPERGVEFELHRNNGSTNHWRFDDYLHAFLKIFLRGHRITSLSLGRISHDRMIDPLRDHMADHDDRLDSLPEQIETLVRERNLRHLSLSFNTSASPLCHRILSGISGLSGLTTLRLINVPHQDLPIPASLTSLTVFKTEDHPVPLVHITFPSTSTLTHFLAEPRYTFGDPRNSADFTVSPHTITHLPPSLTHLGVWNLATAFLPAIAKLRHLRILQLKRLTTPVSQLLPMLRRLPALKTLFLSLDSRPHLPSKLTLSFVTAFLRAPNAPPDRELVLLFEMATFEPTSAVLQTEEVKRNPWGGWRYVKHAWEYEEREEWRRVADWVEELLAVDQEPHVRRMAYGRWCWGGVSWVGRWMGKMGFACRTEERAEGGEGVVTGVRDGEWPRDAWWGDEWGRSALE